MNPTPEDPWRVSFLSLHARAWWYLNQSSYLPPSVCGELQVHVAPRLLLWDDAMAFGSETQPTSLTAYEFPTEDGGRETLVREAVWRRAADLRRASRKAKRTGRPAAFKPTFDVRDAPAPADRLGELLAEAAEFKLPVAWFNEDGSVADDFGGQGFEFFARVHPPTSLRLEWSIDTPPEWKPLLDWRERVRRFLEGCLPGR